MKNTFLLASFFGWVIKRNKTNSFIAGTFSGIFGMIAAIGGPPVALLYRDTDPDEFRPSLNSVFIIGIIITLSLLAFTGRIYIDHIYLFLISLIFSKVSQSFLSASVTYFSIFSGLYVILRNIN